MRVLLDSDVILDFLLARQPHFTNANAIWRAASDDLLDLFISAITPANVFYITRKATDIRVARQMIADLLETVVVCAVDGDVLRAALSSPMTDFEDAVQHASAVAAGVDVIVTQNVRDYRQATLPVLAPAEFVAQHLQQLP